MIRNGKERGPGWQELSAQVIREMGISLPDGWAPFSWSSSDDDAPKGFVKIEGAVAPIGRRTKRHDWKKMDKSTRAVYFIPDDSNSKLLARLASESGVCVDCWNTGEVWHSSGPEGTTYRPCKCGTPIQPAKEELFA